MGWLDWLTRPGSGQPAGDLRQCVVSAADWANLAAQLDRFDRTTRRLDVRLAALEKALGLPPAPVS